MTERMTDRTIGNYRLIRLLGEGGMGVVYEAEHTTMGRRAAVKMLRAESGRDEQTIRRFFNEARATNEVKHPGIVQIYDCGTASDGSPWLIMELLEGETLGARLARLGALPPGEAVEIGAQAASVLAAAHAAGIVHRDLKPDNLFVVPDPNMASGERVKVLDFGIAKLAARDSAAGSMRTQTGMLMGTPLYMSPEQCRGTKQVDFRSDMYSLGLMIYQMLAGQPPFMSEGIGELFHMHMNVQHQPLSERLPMLPAGLSLAVDRALQKEPEARFADMRELQAALLAALKTAPPSVQRFVEQTGKMPVGTRVMSAGTTTLSASAGETSDHETVDELRPAQSRSRAPLAIAALVVLGVGGVLGLRAVRPGATTTTPANPSPPVTQDLPAKDLPVAPPKVEPPPPPVVPPQPAEPARISVDIATTPSRVRLVDAADGHLIGVSPFHDLLPSREGALELRLEKKGYEARTISIPLNQKFSGSFELKRTSGGESSAERIIKL